MTTTVYIDAANLILSSKNLGLDFDIEKLLKYFIYKYKADSCVYFTGNIESLKEYYLKLNKIGVELVFKDLYKFQDKVKANCDVEISHRITFDILNQEVDKIILVSGDGDFSSLLDFAKTKVSEVRLFAITPKDTSSFLKKKGYLKIIYLENIINLVRKGKGPAIHGRIEGTLFNNYSITDTQNLSNYSPIDRKHKKFSVSQQVVIFNFQNQVLILENHEHEWLLPGGRIENIDKNWQYAIKREVLEEICIDKINIIDSIATDFSQMFGCIAVAYSCEVFDLENLKLSNEHISFRWIELNELENNLYYSKLGRQINEYYKNKT